MGSYATNGTDEDVHIPAIQHFHPGVCGTCYGTQEGSSLLRCSQCQMISYCSKTCQKKDWPFHKSVCLVNKTVNNNNVFSSARETLTDKKEWKHWFHLISDLAFTCSLNLNRSLTVREREMFLYPRVCEVCKEANYTLLEECKTCHSVFYCCKEHREINRESHNHWCQHYLLCLQCDSIEAKDGIQDLPFPTHVDENKPLPKDLMALLSPQLRIDPSKTLDHRFVTMIGERLSFPLSLLYALEKLEKGKHEKSFLTSSDLRIHVIGAESSVELLGIIRWEYFLHRLPSLSKLHIVFIGPNLFKNLDPEDEFPEDQHCIEDSGSTRCKDCAKKERIVIYEMASMLYHEYEESEHFTDPNAIITFNCGFHEYVGEATDTWMKSLTLITKTDIPLIFTSYTKSEAEKDLKTVLGSNEGVIVEIATHLNPFCSPRPVRDPAREKGNQLFFYNQYLTCVRGISRYPSNS